MKGNRILGTIPGSLAALQILAGDTIRSIDGIIVPNDESNDVVIQALKATRDAIGAQLSLTVIRQGEFLEGGALFY